VETDTIFLQRRRVPRAKVETRFRAVLFHCPELDPGFLKVVEIGELGAGVEHKGSLHPTQMSTILKGYLRVGLTSIPVSFQVVYRLHQVLGLEFTSFGGDAKFCRGLIRFIFKNELSKS